jgi:signal transduction histidine kinase
LVSVQSILSDSLDLSEAQLRSDGIDLNVDFPNTIPAIKVRTHQIQQVFMNIISNARYALNQKFPSANPKKALEISGDVIDTNGTKYARLIFLDYGIGIRDAVLDRIGAPFFSTKPVGEGTGLGLSVSQAILSDHDGRFTFDSTEGQYTKVIIELPVAAAL